MITPRGLQRNRSRQGCGNLAGSGAGRQIFLEPNCTTVSSAFPKLCRPILFFLGRVLVLHLRHFLRKTGGVFFVLDIINGEGSKHIVGIVPGPILIRIRVCHL
jgi:hypothetical protein